jgi:3-hydroxyisobutyrate dehydrogenase
LSTRPSLAPAGQRRPVSSRYSRRGQTRPGRCWSQSFAAIGSRTWWLGPAGAGSRLKLVLNTWLAFLVEGIAETASLADVLGVSHDALAHALAGGPLGAGLAEAKLAKMDAGDDSPDFSLRWALKDVDLAVEASGGWRLPVTAAISSQWHELARSGMADKDVSVVRSGLG